MDEDFAPEAIDTGETETEAEAESGERIAEAESGGGSRQEDGEAEADDGSRRQEAGKESRQDAGSAERAAKKWAGQFETPEDLEKAYFDQNRRYSEIERQRQEASAKPQENPYQKMLESEYTKEYRKQKARWGDYQEDETIKQWAMEEAAEKVDRQYQFDQRLEQIQFRSDPVVKELEPMVDQIAYHIPEVAEVAKDPKMRKALIALLKSGRQTAQKIPGPPPKPKADKREDARTGGRGSGRKDSYHGLSEGEYKGLKERFGWKSKEAYEAYVKASGKGGKR